MNVKMEGVMQEVSKCGKFQVCHVTLIQFCRFVAAWAYSLMIFGLYNPGWRCDERNSTLSSVIRHNSQNNETYSIFPKAYRSTSFNSTTDSSLSQTVYGNDVTAEDHARQKFNNNSVQNSSYNSKEVLYSSSSSCNAITSCRIIKFKTTSSTIVTEFGLVCDKVWMAYIIVSVLNCGMLLGAFVWGQIGERFGRTVGLYGSCLIMILSCGLAVFSPTWQVYAAFTFLIGFGVVGTVSACPPLCMEFLDSKWRARLASFPVWNMSGVSFAFITFVLRDWRHIHLATALVCGIAFLGCFWTPESLRWLLIHGKTPRARKVIEKISKLNKLSVPSGTLTHLVDTDCKADKNTNFTYLDLFRTRDLCIITVKLGVIGVVLSLSYDILGFGIQSLPGDFYTNLVVASLIELPGTLSVGLLAIRIGRRWAGILFEVIGIVCCSTIVVSLLSMEKCQTRDILVTSMAFINKAGVQANLSLMLTYTAELVPTAVRNLTFGVSFTLSRLACIAGPYLLPRDYASMIACFSVLVLIQLVAVYVFFSLPETKNIPIDDTIIRIKRNKHREASVI